MKKKVKNILLWVVSWIVLLVVIAYSPIGSPGLYHQNQNGNRIDQILKVIHLKL